MSKYTIDDDDDDTDSLDLSPFHMSIADFSLTEAAVVLSLEYSIENVPLYVPWFFPVFFAFFFFFFCFVFPGRSKWFWPFYSAVPVWC